MPAIRTQLRSTKVDAINKSLAITASAVEQEMQDLTDCKINYPLTEHERKAFKTSDGKRVTPHQWAVYDFSRTIPCGRVTTYKDICVALGQGSPRSVGSALRNNPFAPFVPCHRIIASNLYIGGFFGEWGTGTNARGGQKNTGVQCNRKMEMLGKEGVGFSADGYLADESLLWSGRL
ncbi:DNA binding methylated-DNA--cysteine S-methyltransferase [Rhizopogon salebrosus TDB-379]|nr:DNA binding methylated-DNA--cysteine S-methyltransferase [Rhizopogon salebrosus TDB-379]